MTKTIPEDVTYDPIGKKYWLNSSGALYHPEFGSFAIPYDNKYDAEDSYRWMGFGVDKFEKSVLINKLINFLETL